MLRRTYRPRPIYTLITGAIALGLGVSAYAIPLLLLLAVPFAVQFAVFLSLRLEVDDHGISVGASWLPTVLNRSGSWPQVTWTWTPGVVQISNGRARPLRAVIDLKMFDPDWRTGPIGADLIRFAPGLMAELDARRTAPPREG